MTYYYYNIISVKAAVKRRCQKMKVLEYIGKLLEMTQVIGVFLTATVGRKWYST